MNPYRKGLFGHMGRRYKDTHLHTISLPTNEKYTSVDPKQNAPKKTVHVIHNKHMKRQAASSKTSTEIRESERYLGTQMDESIHSRPPRKQTGGHLADNGTNAKKALT